MIFRSPQSTSASASLLLPSFYYPIPGNVKISDNRSRKASETYLTVPGGTDRFALLGAWVRLEQ
jgi:hypothetical protein